MTRSALRSLLWCGAVTLIALGCSSDITPPAGGAPPRLQPRGVALYVGQTATFTVSNAPVGSVVRLEVRDSSALGIVNSLDVVAKRPTNGFVLLNTRSGVDSVPVLVVDLAACPATARIVPESLHLMVGDSVRLSVFHCGSVLEDYEFSSSSITASVTPRGVVTAMAQGSAVITARSREDPSMVATAAISVE